MNEALLFVAPNGEVKQLEGSEKTIEAAIGLADYFQCNSRVGAHVMRDSITNREEFNHVASIILSRAIFGPVVLAGRAPLEPVSPIVSRLVIANCEVWAKILESAAQMGQEVLPRANPDVLPSVEGIAWEDLLEEGGDSTNE